MSTATLRVRTNPFFAIDHHGCPAGAVPQEFIVTRLGLWRSSDYIGARRSEAKLEREGADGPGESVVGKFQKKRHHVRYRFERGTIEIPLTRYNRRQVAEGCLLAADAETAQRCGVKFVPPDTALENARKASGCEVEPLWKEDSAGEQATTPATAADEPKATPAEKPAQAKRADRAKE